MSNHHALGLATVGYICPDDEIELVGTVSPAIVAAETINPQIIPKPVAPPSIICEDPPPPVRTLTGLVDKEECCAILIPNLKPRIG